MAISSSCYQCEGVSDTVNHALFGWPYWSGNREDLEVQLGFLLSLADWMDIVCGPAFENLPVNPEHKETILGDI